ncbi:MAG: hypothetical protein KF822_09450 [Steroidobacteraceae bacterium]|nr:hypothetical protein [Steroidobacteraceae bacterium]
MAKVKAVGAASFSVDTSNNPEVNAARKRRSQVIEAAMSAAVKRCYAAGVTDPVKIREAMMAARAEVKGE